MILFYAAKNNRVVDILEQQLTPYKVHRCFSLNTVEKKLRRPGHGLLVALMIVRNSEEMEQINAIGNLIRDVKLILVLPGHESAMVSKAHKLGPRFIAYADNGCDTVGAVLERMLPAERADRSSIQNLQPTMD